MKRRQQPQPISTTPHWKPRPRPLPEFTGYAKQRVHEELLAIQNTDNVTRPAYRNERDEDWLYVVVALVNYRKEQAAYLLHGFERGELIGHA